MLCSICPCKKSKHPADSWLCRLHSYTGHDGEEEKVPASRLPEIILCTLLSHTGSHMNTEMYGLVK